ncbi:hydrogenase maturation nickel metallochaperone HypA [bacterium]|nr:hydrogenase maturation nickel metallochaperone HypA [bacterium]
MHEMSLLKDVVEVVDASARQANVDRVQTVCMTIGDGRDIVFDIVDGLFAYLARGTRCEGANLEIRHVPFTVQCRQCGEVFPINVFKPETWTCPKCGAQRDYDLHSGMEFRIDEIVAAPSEIPAYAAEQLVS